MKTYILTLRSWILEINKVKSYLGYAIKSRNIIFGYDNILSSKIKPFYIVISSTLNEKMTNKLLRFADEKNIKIKKLTSYRLEDFVMRENCKVVALTDVNLASALECELSSI